MAELGKLKQLSQGTIHIQSVTSGTLHAAQIAIAHVDYPATEYDGEYTITPSDTEQTISISGKVAEHDIVVAAIPNNYGRVEWNGVTLSVI